MSATDYADPLGLDRDTEDAAQASREPLTREALHIRLDRIEARLDHLGADHGLMGDSLDRIEQYVRDALGAVEQAAQALPAMLGGGGGLGGMLGAMFGGGRRQDLDALPDDDPEPDTWDDDDPEDR